MRASVASVGLLATGAVLLVGCGSGGADSPNELAPCDRFIECAREAQPSAALGANEAYGSRGACWQTEPHEVCEQACTMGLAALHDLHPDEPACAECRADAECAAPTPVCSAARNECAQCASDEHCGGSTPACDVARGECVPCVTDAHCGGATPACADNVCVECTSATHCAIPEPLCDTELRVCTAGCRVDAHCPTGEHCLLDAREPQCVECFSDDHCAAPARCGPGNFCIADPPTAPVLSCEAGWDEGLGDYAELAWNGDCDDGYRIERDVGAGFVLWQDIAPGRCERVGTARDTSLGTARRAVYRVTRYNRTGQATSNECVVAL